MDTQISHSRGRNLGDRLGLLSSINDIRALVILSILSVFPFFAYISLDFLGRDPKYIFSFLCYLFLAEFLFSSFKTGRSIRVPYYLIVFGIFNVYAILTGIFVSGHLLKVGLIKFLYSDLFFTSFWVVLLIENTHFPEKFIRVTIQILFATLLIAAVVSVIQISKPLFFVNVDIPLGEDASFESILAFSPVPGEENSVTELIKERRILSIYTWINSRSAGFDAIAVLSLLFGLRTLSLKKKFLAALAGGFISFLSSSRWIMLNFFVVLSQYFVTAKNKFFNIFKLLFLSVAIIFVIGYGASYFGYDVERFVNERLFDETAGTRLYAFEIFSRVYPTRPILGTGGEDTPDMERLLFGRTSQIHVGYLKLFYYYGLVGGIIYLFFLGVLFWQLWLRARQSSYWGSFFAFLAFAAANLTLVEFDIYYHGLFLALIFSKAIINNRPPEATPSIV